MLKNRSTEGPLPILRRVGLALDRPAARWVGTGPRPHRGAIRSGTAGASPPRPPPRRRGGTRQTPAHSRPVQGLSRRERDAHAQAAPVDPRIALIFVLDPPRDRPRACCARLSIRSILSGISRPGSRRPEPGPPPWPSGRSGCRSWSADRGSLACRARVGRSEAPRKMRFRTLRSATRATPRGLSGSGWRTGSPPKSVRSRRTTSAAI